MPEVKVDLDREGRVAGAHVAENTESHQIIEEFMLAANEAVAEMLRDKRACISSAASTSRPARAKLKALTRVRPRVGLAASTAWKAASSCRSCLDEVAGPAGAARRQLRRAAVAAAGRLQPAGRRAITPWPAIAIATSPRPIRRYPDLTIHRLLDDLLAGRKPRTNFDELVVLGQHCSDREQRAEAAERELTKLKLLAYLSERIGEEMDGVVTGVENFGLFVARHRAAGRRADPRRRPERRLLRLRPRDAHARRPPLGQHAIGWATVLRVAVARVDLERRELDFRLVARKAASRKGREAKAPRRYERRGMPCRLSSVAACSLVVLRRALDRADRNRVDRADVDAIAAADAVVAVDPNVCGCVRVVGRNLDEAQRLPVGVPFQAAEAANALPRRNLDAPVAVDALVLVDLELVMAQIAAPGVRVGRLAEKSQLDFLVSASPLGGEDGHPGRVQQIVVAEPAGGLGRRDANALDAPPPAHEKFVHLQGGGLAVGRGADHVGVARGEVAGDEQSGHARPPPAGQRRLRREDAALLRLPNGVDQRVAGQLEVALRHGDEGGFFARSGRLAEDVAAEGDGAEPPLLNPGGHGGGQGFHADASTCNCSSSSRLADICASPRR